MDTKFAVMEGHYEKQSVALATLRGQAMGVGAAVAAAVSVILAILQHLGGS